MIFGVLRVRGDSLAPRFQSRDYVIVSRLPLASRQLALGDVVVFCQPEYGQLIKRVEQVYPDGSVEVRGDDIDSIDSRLFGPVRQADVLGLVVWHIPAPRR